MEFPISEVVSAILRLLPGFAAAWVFHALTAHKKPTPFERTVQALIFTGIVLPFVGLTQWVALLIGKQIGTIGPWTESAATGFGMLYGVLLGLLVSYLANNNILHPKLAALGITQRTSFASEWSASFYKSKRYIYLTLEDGRRIFGWPHEYPDQCDEGHFVLDCPMWLLPSNQKVPFYMIEKILIPAKLVQLVEFEKPEAGWTHTPEQLAETTRLLCGDGPMSRMKGETDGRTEDNKQ